MTGRRFTLEPVGVAFLVAAMGLSVSAQTDQLLPEIDAYYKLTPDMRLSLQAKETREGGDPTQAEISS